MVYFQMAGKDLLLKVEYVKFRSSGASRSPVGTFSVFEDRVEWVEKDGTESLVISFSDIKGSRVYGNIHLNFFPLVLLAA